MDWTLAFLFCEQVSLLLIALREGFQIHPDSTGYDWIEETPILVLWSFLSVHQQKSKSSVDCHGCHLFLVQDEAQDSQDVILQFKVARKWKSPKLANVNVCAVWLSWKQPVNSNRSSIFFNRLRFQHVPTPSLTRTLGPCEASFVVSEWLGCCWTIGINHRCCREQGKRAKAFEFHALDCSVGIRERWSTRPTS